jgi:hypothetical protein
MTWVYSAIAVGVLGAGATIYAGSEAAGAASDQQAYNNQIAEANKRYRLEVMAYQNDDYSRQTTHYGANLAYEKEEFGRAKDLANLEFDNVEKNYAAELGTTLLRSVQEDIASVLQTDTTNSQVATQKGAFAARVADGNVAGNSVALVQGEIDRQGGEARRAIERNNEATKNQLNLQLLGIKADRDTKLGSISMPSFAPLQPPSPPAPVSPVNPAAPVAIPSTAVSVINGIGTGVNLAGGILNLSHSLTI